MARKTDLALPERPDGFYEDWDVFCAQVLSVRLEAGGDDAAVVLLAGGAILGSAGLLHLVVAHKAAIDRKGREWGIPNLSAIAGVGAGVLTAAAGGLTIAWLTRTLGRHADTRQVDGLQARLSSARREFDTLAEHRRAARLPVGFHRAAVDRLFDGLAAGV